MERYEQVFGKQEIRKVSFFDALSVSPDLTNPEIQSRLIQGVQHCADLVQDPTNRGILMLLTVTKPFSTATGDRTNNLYEKYLFLLNRRLINQSNYTNHRSLVEAKEMMTRFQESLTFIDQITSSLSQTFKNFF